MNEEQRKAMYIANCNCCTLALAMRTCKLCIFRIGISNNIETWREIMEEVKKWEEKEKKIK